ncbi:HXXEE domain-containing protein [Brevibacillus humidisoli]|uniref:HXXEE domain-containing protein n=1 Tax=Brevibacillus humidisoli TaxID=2895522 RepID=UPI001E3958B0|nr:HXXEE domain-containing protein [Brevibacillus humidisoli]UFJ39321.1 HXXEE domain-containing protein [Brevibacillus humidisoli]
MLSYLDNKLSLKQLIWLFPVIFLIHDAEEVITFEWWMQANLDELQSLVGSSLLAPLILASASMTTVQFAIAVGVIFVFILSSSYLAARSLTMGGGMQYFLVCLTVMTANVFTHVGQSVLFHGYTPGVVTAVTVLLPYTWYMYRRLRGEQHLQPQSLKGSLPYALLALPVLYLAHAIGRLIG